MSASIVTVSPTTRLAGKLPSSTAGETPTMMTRRRPSTLDSGTSPLVAACMPLLERGEQRAASGQRVVQFEQQPLGATVSQRRPQRQNVLVPRRLRFRAVE